MNYQPKGGQCITCHYSASNCKDLPFALMPVIERYGEVTIVRCTTHVNKGPQATQGLMGQKWRDRGWYPATFLRRPPET
jgi:hypothetical protein